MDKQERLKHYLERHVRWTENSLNQLTFFNNILVTLTIAFISFAFNLKAFHGLAFSSHVNWSLTFSVFSITLAIVSAISGVYFSFNRLYDFLLSRHLNLTRYRMLKYHDQILNADSYGQDDQISGLRKWFLSFDLLTGYPYKIIVCKGQDSDAIGQVKENFINMRKITYNLGLVTGKLLTIQVISFISCLFAYLLSIFCG
jgi:hypothetical protein